MQLTRRQLLGGLVSSLAAPAIVRAASLMPVRSLPLIGGIRETWQDFETGATMIGEGPISDFTTDNLIVRATERYSIMAWNPSAMFGTEGH